MSSRETGFSLQPGLLTLGEIGSLSFLGASITKQIYWIFIECTKRLYGDTPENIFYNCYRM